MTSPPAVDAAALGAIATHAVCETPAVAAPSPALAAYAGYVYTLDGESVVTDAGGGGRRDDRGGFADGERG